MASPNPEALLRAGQTEEALRLIRQDAAANPNNIEAQELHIDAMLTVGLAPNVERTFRDRVKSDPTNPDSHYLLGRAVTDYREARSSYENALKLDAGHARSYMGLAAIHDALGDAESAQQGYATAVKLDPSLSEAWIGNFRNLVTLQRLPEASALIAPALAACPNEPALHLMAAANEPERSLEILEGALQTIGPDARLYDAHATALLASQRPAEAAEAAGQALKLQPGLPSARLTQLFAKELDAKRLSYAGYRSLITARELPPAEGLPKFEQIVAAHPRSALAQLGLASTQEQLGKPSLAAKVVAADLDPSNVEARAVLGLALINAGQPGPAGDHLAFAYQQRPFDVSLGLGLAKSMVGRGDQGPGLELLRSLVQRFPFSVEVALTAADELSKAGKAEEAYQVLSSTLSRIPDPRLAAGFVVAATQAGHYEAAASLLDQVVAQTGNDGLRQAAARLRAMASEKR